MLQYTTFMKILVKSFAEEVGKSEGKIILQN